MVQLSDVTEIKLDGAGTFDAFMRVVRLHVNDAITKGEVTQGEAGAIYIGVIPSLIQEAVRFELSQEAANVDIQIKEAQLANEQDKLLTAAKQRDVLTQQELLYKRQRAGFDDNKAQKILDSQLNAWGITFQDTDTTFIPSQISQPEFTTSMTAVRTDYFASL